MVFDPSLPVDGSLIVAGELRGQFTGLKYEIDAKPLQAQLSNDLVTADGSYNPTRLDELIRKMNELTNALR